MDFSDLLLIAPICYGFISTLNIWRFFLQHKIDFMNFSYIDYLVSLASMGIIKSKILSIHVTGKFGGIAQKHNRQK